MKKLQCDVAVIGAGTAGLAATRAALQAGAKVLLIESGPGGTTCTRSGCMPSKLLIAAADVAHSAGTASVFGIQTAPLRIEGRAVMSRVRQERDRFVAGVLKDQSGIARQNLIHGHARFTGPRSLSVDDQTQVDARAIVIATGARVSVPPLFDAIADRVLTHENLFELADLPASIAVIGAGPIGLELGQALHRLGVRTMIFDQDRKVGGLRNDDMNRLGVRLLGSMLLPMRLGTQISVGPEPGGVRLHWRDDDDGGSAFYDYVLVATGRKPDLSALNLSSAGVELDERKLPKFDPATMRCGDSAIFIAGDAASDRPLLHEAADEGEIAGRNAAAFPKVQTHARRVPMAVTFSDPQIAVIGDVTQSQRAIGRVDFSDQGRAKVINRAAGLLQIYADSRSGVLRGAEMIGPSAEHLAHLLAWAIQQKASAQALLDMPFYHPTLEEGLRTALREVCTQLHAWPVAVEAAG